MRPVLFISSGLPKSAARSRLRSHHTQSWRSVALSSWLAAYCIRRFETPGTCPIPVTIETFASFAFASRESTFWRAGPSAAMSPTVTPAGEAEQVGDREDAVFAGPEFALLRTPQRADAQVRGRVAAEESDEDLRDDAPADRAESAPLAQHLGFLQDVEEEGRTRAEGAQEGFGERLHLLGVQDEILRKSEGPRDRLTGGQPEGLPSLQVALGERVDLLRDRVREDADAERELRVDLPARLRFELAPVELEKPGPLDHVPRGEFPEAPQVLGGWLCEDRDVLHLVVELVFPADHAVPEPVRADGELDGHEWALRPVEEPREDRERLDRLRLLGDRDLECDGMEDVLDHFGPDEPREEVVDHGPLVMPADDPASLVEPPIGREARDRRRVDDPVVELQDPQGEPGDDQVLVVAGVPEQGPRLRLPREVVLAGLVVANQKMDAVLIVQEWLVVRSAAVD